MRITFQSKSGIRYTVSGSTMSCGDSIKNHKYKTVTFDGKRSEKVAKQAVEFINLMFGSKVTVNYVDGQLSQIKVKAGHQRWARLAFRMLRNYRNDSWYTFVQKVINVTKEGVSFKNAFLIALKEVELYNFSIYTDLVPSTNTINNSILVFSKPKRTILSVYTNCGSRVQSMLENININTDPAKGMKIPKVNRSAYFKLRKDNADLYNKSLRKISKDFEDVYSKAKNYLEKEKLFVEMQTKVRRRKKYYKNRFLKLYSK
jgi:hypothetical protein